MMKNIENSRSTFFSALQGQGPIAFIILLSLMLQIVSSYVAREPIPSFDSVFFLSIARNILEFGEIGWIGYHEPLFYSLVTAVFSFFSDNLLDAGILVSRVSGLMLVAVTYYLAKDIYNKKVAVISALFVALMPHIQTISTSPQSEALYSLLITSSVYLLYLTFKKRTVLSCIVAAVFFTLAYLTRSEGIFVFVFLVCSLILIDFRKMGLKSKFPFYALLIFIVFTVLSFPYFLYLKGHYKTWTLGTKSSAIYFWIRNKSFNDPDPERLEWGLSPEGELNLISMKSKDVINYWLKDPSKSIRIYMKNLKQEIPGFIPNSSGIKQYPQVLPIYFALPLVIGLLIRKLRKASMEGDCYLMSVFLIFFIYPFFTEGWWRYLVNYSPVFMILSASGFNEVNEYLKKRSNTGTSEKRTNMLFFILLTVISAYHIWTLVGKKLPPDMKRYNDRKYELAMESKKAGLWAQKNLPPKSNYMISWSRLAYYLDGKWTAMPETDFTNMLRYAKKNNVDYIVYEGLNRQQVIGMKRTMATVPDLKIATVYKSKNLDYNVVFLKLLKNTKNQAE